MIGYKRPTLQTPGPTHHLLPVEGREGSDNTFSYLAWQTEAGASLSWLPDTLSSGSAERGGVGVCVLTSSTFALGDWAPSAVLTVPGHPIWGSGPRTVSCCHHCLLLSPGMGGPPYARAQGLSPRPTSVTHCLGTPLC